MIAGTPTPPYYAVIFTSQLSPDAEGYEEMAEQLIDLVSQQPGFLGFESVRNEIGITISYWESLEAIKAWKQNEQHLIAQQKGRARWYASYKTRICLVERD